MVAIDIAAPVPVVRGIIWLTARDTVFVTYKTPILRKRPPPPGRSG
jgi:hypothetical protein